ncbi:hypothetical protein JCM8202v2_006152 [Rhodotorula sphaerocarpa]
MGQAESHPQATHEAGGGDGSAHAALHVLRVAENSPAAEAGVEPFFDFVVGAGGQQIGDDIDYLTDVLEQNEGAEVPLQIYSTKRKEIREVHVIPSRNWSSAAVPNGQAGTVDGQPSLLGLSLRVWHVLDILEGSPAQNAGLVPHGDWIIGYAGGVLRGEGDFYDVVEAHEDMPLRLFVYNSDYDVTREAILVPNRSWGGEGLLGCGVGYGLLHRVPKPQDRVEPPPHPDPPRTASGLPAAAPPSASENSRRYSGFSSVSSNAPPMQNPLYAPPPPRAGAPTPPRPGGSIASPPPPPRRTAALASPPGEDRRSLSGSRQQLPQQRMAAPRYAPPPPRTSKPPVHPSFSHAPAGEDDSRFGEYDASDGVEVVAVGVEEEPSTIVSPIRSKGSQHSLGRTNTRPPPPSSQARGGPVYARPPPPPAPSSQYGRTSSDSYGRQSEQVIGIEAE